VEIHGIHFLRGAARGPSPRGQRVATYHFGDCELDTQRVELRRGGEPRHVEPQVYDVLCHLIERRERLVTKEELLDGIWGHRFVTPATLNSRIKAARQAIGDDGAAQRIIRTVRGRGFRFVADVRIQEDAPASRLSGTDVVRVAAAGPPPPDAQPGVPLAGALPPPHTWELVGRDSEMQRLDALLRAASGGARRLACVAGESGIGKSALVDAFVARARATGHLRVARGQCLDRQGPGEAYLPILDAFGRLGREPGGEDVVAGLEACAPTWLAQMPSLLGPERLEAVQRGAFGATRERMLREMVEALELISRDTPLLLVLEDLHWSDPSTLDLLSWIGQRGEPARLLVLGTYRPGDAEADLSGALATLRRSGRFLEIQLRPWGEAEVREHLARRVPDRVLPEPLVEHLCSRAEGNPLFVETLLEAWIEHGALDRLEGNGVDAAVLAELSAAVPATLRVLIEQRIGRCSGDDKRLLEAASVAGIEFTAALVAAATGEDEEVVEERCSAVARRGLMVEETGMLDGPDGSPSTSFRFGHHLFREVLYEGIPHVRRVRLHRAIGHYIEAAFGERAAERAGELALHFRAGRDDERAVRHLRVAAEQALGRNAHGEAIGHLTAALETLARRPDLPDALRVELDLQRMLGPALLVTRGWGDPDAERAYVRARELSERLDDPGALARVLYGLAYMHEIRGNYRRSEALVQERLSLGTAEARPGPGFAIESHELLSCALFHQGRFDQALDSANLALAVLGEVARDDFIVSFDGDNAAVASHYWAGLALWFLGYPDRALGPVLEARDLSDRLQLVYMQAAAEWQLARLRIFRQEIHLAAKHADRSRLIAERQGYPYPLALALALSGPIRIHQGDTSGGLRLLRQGLEMQEEMGADMERPYCLGLLAEALLGAGQTSDSLATSDQALALIARRSRAFFWEAEVHRIRGEAFLREDDVDAAETSFRIALATAARQHARALELRAAMSLCRLQERAPGPADGRQRLAELYATFTEGFDTPDLRAARMLLQRTPAG
jgi:predicted ATPase/DNA-binding winged helix-turn-helix (wHTH) protein